jgi:hypothetical protein
MFRKRAQRTFPTKYNNRLIMCQSIVMNLSIELCDIILAETHFNGLPNLSLYMQTKKFKYVLFGKIFSLAEKPLRQTATGRLNYTWTETKQTVSKKMHR